VTVNKYVLELNDEEAESLIKVLEYAAEPGELSGWSSELALSAAASLKKQIPVPVPTGIGAVVLTHGATDDRVTSGNNYFIRWAHDKATTSPWIEAGNHEDPFRTDSIGRITEVLSPGVDL
jgi:hypothetical protein